MFRIAAILLMPLLILMSTANAQDTDELQTAQIELICAAASLASYSDEQGELVRDMLKGHGFEIESIIDETDKARAKALIAERASDSMKVLSISGTGEMKDAAVDFRTKMQPFKVVKPNINNENAYARPQIQWDFRKSDTELTDPEFIANNVMVHEGFQDYTEVMLENDKIKTLVSELRFNKNNKLYITGHSLGGAVAIIIAAKMIELGAEPEQIQVVTFGAPAVGNKKFAEEYGNKINVKRITVSGDPIKKSLQLLGYAHIGKEIKYKPDKTVEHFPHMMAVYLDCAIRNYYDAKGFETAMLSDTDEKKINDRIYVAPMQVMKKSFNENDFKYIRASLRDGLIRQLPRAVYDGGKVIEVDEVNNLAEFNDDITAALKFAKELKCKYILVQYLQSKKMKKDEMGNYRVSLEEIIYDLNGFPVSMQTSSITTKELTLIEAAIFAQENLGSSRLQFNK